ncbi:unnamed protein product, partial [Ascophyllum nodosum]
APFTPQQLISVYDYRTSATVPRVTTHVANHPPFTDRVPPARDFSPLAPLRASQSMSSTIASTTASPKTTTGTSAKATTRTASPPPFSTRYAPGPLANGPHGPSGLHWLQN